MKGQNVKEALEDYVRQNMQNPDTDLWPGIMGNLHQNEQTRPVPLSTVESYPATRLNNSLRLKRGVNRFLVAGLAGVTVLLFIVIAWAVLSTPFAIAPTNTVVAFSTPSASAVNASPTPTNTTQIILKINGPTQNQEQLTKIQTILEIRLKVLGANYSTFDFSTPGVIKVQVRGVKDRVQLVSTLTSTGRVEFVDAGYTQLKTGDLITTSYCTTGSLYQPQAGLCQTTSSSTTPGAVVSAQKAYQTVITGEELDLASLKLLTETSGATELGFGVKPSAASVLQQFTSQHLQQTMAITLDGKVVSAPTIQGTISSQGQISAETWNTPAGKDEALSLWAILQSSPLPVKLTPVSAVDLTTTQHP